MHFGVGTQTSYSFHGGDIGIRCLALEVTKLQKQSDVEGSLMGFC